MTLTEARSLEKRATTWERAMPAASVLMLLAVAFAVFLARHWPLVHDAVLIHYVVFLMEHGRAPYRDIVEMNMPGTYMAEWAVMHLFGGGAVGWKEWDLLLGATAIAASAWIAGAGKRWAGVGAGALAYLSHLADGAEHLGQRDWLVAVMLLLAVGCLFQSLRAQQPLWMVGFAGFCGCGASIKPPVALFGLVFLVAAGWQLWKEHGAAAGSYWKRYLLCSLAGAAIPALATLAFLLRWGATGAFLETLRGILPWYAGLQAMSTGSLLKGAIVFRPLICGAAIVFAMSRSWRSWESDLLAVAALVGVGFFVLQGKGWPYHLYPEKVFAALWAMLELQRGLAGREWERLVAAATLSVTTFLMVPRLLFYESKDHYPIANISHLERDLGGLGGSALSGHIQCLDMTEGGCINTLYRMKLLQSTGFIYDFYLFPKQPTAMVEALQGRFLREIGAGLPKVIVLSSQTWPGGTQGYQQIENWPAFDQFLLTHYELDREFPIQVSSAGYRIYLLRGVAAQ